MEPVDHDEVTPPVLQRRAQRTHPQGLRGESVRGEANDVQEVRVVRDTSVELTIDPAHRVEAVQPAVGVLQGQLRLSDPGQPVHDRDRRGRVDRVIVAEQEPVQLLDLAKPANKARIPRKGKVVPEG
jgi:hypothetical protein